MVPPALLEIIENVPQTVFYHFEGDGGEEDEFEVTADQSFEEPAQEVGECEKIEAGVVESAVVDLAALSVADFLVVDKGEGRVDVGSNQFHRLFASLLLNSVT